MLNRIDPRTCGRTRKKCSRTRRKTNAWPDILIPHEPLFCRLQQRARLEDILAPFTIIYFCVLGTGMRVTLGIHLQRVNPGNKLRHDEAGRNHHARSSRQGHSATALTAWVVPLNRQMASVDNDPSTTASYTPRRAPKQGHEERHALSANLLDQYFTNAGTSMLLMSRVRRVLWCPAGEASRYDECSSFD